MDSSMIMQQPNNKLTTDQFTGFERFLESYGLPIDNVIASQEERQRIMQALPDFLNSLPMEARHDARYLSKFVAGSAVGLFDAALNFVWNEVVISLRKKIIVYGLEYFYDNAIGGTFREQYKDENDLPSVKDQVLIDTCKKLELISDLLHRKLCHILDMRNQVGSSHPNDYAINAYELLGWLQTCIQEVFMDKISEAALTVKSLIDNAKRITTVIDQSYLTQFDKSVKDLSSNLASNLLTSLFGIFVSPSYEDRSVERKNILNLAIITWQYCSEKTKFSLGEKIDSYRANLDEYKTTQAELFFSKCGGERYFSKDAKIIKLTLLCEQLESTHYAWDNYAHEVPVARDIMSMIHSVSDIPEIRMETLLKTFLLCRIGNDRYYYEGISPGGQKFYDRLFSILDEKCVLIVVNLLSKNEHFLIGTYRPKHVKAVCSLMKSEMLSDKCKEMLDYIIDFKGKLQTAFVTKDFKVLAVGKIDY